MEHCLVNARITVSGLKAVGFRFDGIEQRSVNATPLMEEWYLTTLDMIQETFDREGARAGFPRWQFLSHGWTYEKARHSGDPRILRDTGEMFRALTTPRDPSVYVRIERLAVIIRPRDQLMRARVHMQGSKKPKTNIPQRAWLRIGPQDKTAFGKSLVRFIKDGKI